jgi:uncharacterized protein YozE (UPF0346 family)
MTFYKWIKKKYLRESNQFHELANFIERNTNAPRKAKRKKTIKKYLRDANASQKMMQAFEAAYEKYVKEVNDGD